ncbi:hypothetical protein IHQ71_28355 [Rhizobium sp. TH2]|uniref:HNH endonuclease n=1 Tax=Rhizobium sp. TH2 TaxID=2775403 RepID=UPI0021587AF9|nr:HNH endonuclease [Rhizobium sp. TH2]UVC08978.1 hypothetical protein IHQ71_28355 [Rhizobium sp. TH2]
MMKPDVVLPPMVSYRYPAVGRCIYCGATEYSSDTDRQLAEEHIIPFGLNGDLVIPQASCRACERITGRDDALLLRGMLLAPRIQMAFRSREPRKLPKALPVFSQSNRKTMIDVEDYPSTILMLRYPAPPILSAQKEPLFTDLWVKRFPFDVGKLRRKYGIDDFAPGSHDSYSFKRVLAKIAHGYAVAELGLDGFEAILSERIRDRNDFFHDCVGGAGIEEIPDRLHSLSIEPRGESDFVVVRIHLLCFLGTPVYRVVVGRWL